MNKITKIKQSKDLGVKELQDNYQLLRDLMDFIPDVIYFKDKKGRFIMVNQAHAKGLGVKPEALIGKTDFDLFSRNRARKMIQDDMHVMDTGKPIIDKVERATRPDGIDNYVSTTKIPRYNDKGKVVGLIGITRDITRRMQFERLRKDKLSIERKLEALEELSAMKSEFISTVSHELRTPLAVIKGLVSAVFNEVVGQINRKQKEVLQKTLDNTERLKKIIDDLLDISRIERNTLKLHYSLVDIVDLMKDSEGFFMKLAEEKDIYLKYVYPDEPVNVFIDADRIRQVISNLISNAIKFTMDGGRIKVEVKILEAKVRIGVIDTGIGISKADLPSIFNKFTQVSKLSGAENKGVGLGLSISKKLVERHKGEIWAESKAGVGSRFYFTLRRFYTLDMLGKGIRDKVGRLMKNGISMHFVSLLILNCSEFRKRMQIGSESLFKDLHAILDLVLKNAKYGNSDKQVMSVINPRAGKFSIILPGASSKQAADISSLLKYRIRQYFANNKVEDVFITIGSLSYSQKVFSHDNGFSPSRFSIKEIYIGSEMRRFKRMSFKTNIKLFLPEEKVELSESVDVSEGGICLVIKHLLKTDSQLKISFVFPENREFVIVAKVRVAWIRKIELLFGEDANKYKVGLEFVNLENRYKRVICRRLMNKSQGA
ncbi:MAG: ATP-binding protein [Candidatus Omnitrophica bacterium]|nr:ATP-binding protein [Candidatus Omnitrophota bacterium]MDD5690739.1 ATP-binding protein [Candidatus Omnitrophota bacterium]